MRSADIKNLCIAREALSRIPGYQAESHSIRIGDLISDLLKKEETRTEPAPRSISKQTDEIPF